ncbi:MAG: AAA family ATPase [Chloroflexi bacterium]|nr:AAA family ATPase [Chloroflexota bacterium]
MIENRLRGLWEQLQGKKPHMPHFLSEIRLDGIRGVNNLRVVLDYPVSVIAGGNATGKSTVLFAAACAYKVPDAGPKDFVPSTLFPDYRPKLGGREDERPTITLQFDYSTSEGRLAMQWQRNKGWSRNFLGRKGVKQPERQVYLRTLSNLSNPSEVRGVLSMSRLTSEPNVKPLTALQVEFAKQMLPFRYSEVVDLSSGKKNLLFAAHEGGPQYSELHMAAGERAILRLSQEIAQLDGALVLIDEVEAGLHPWVQQLLMLQLQQLALRRDLQIIVTSHSPVVLESVPPNGRIFLERDDSGQVTVAQPYRDLIQDALYGRSTEALNLLCEDEVAEGILQGVFDYLLPQLRVRNESVRIGRDTGADQFPEHAAAFRKFGQVQNFVFVLDGDKRDSDAQAKIHDKAGRTVPVLFLPSRDAPETWVWDRLRQRTEGMAGELGLLAKDLTTHMDRLDATYDSASDPPSQIAKSKLRALADLLARDAAGVGRIVARVEAGLNESDIQPLVEGLRDALAQWRSD